MTTVPFAEKRASFFPQFFFLLTKVTGFLAPFPREETKAGEEYRARAAWWLAGRHRRRFKAWRRSVSYELLPPLLLLGEKRGGHGASKASDAGYGKKIK
jgi:hypothetical protein